MSDAIVPTAPHSETSEVPAEETPASPVPSRRRGWIIALVVVGVLVVLAIIAFPIAEAIAKDYARGYVRERVVEVLKLPADADLDVDLGGGSIILQALAGRVDQVDVDVPEVAFGDLTGGLRMHAEGVPLDAEAPLDVLRIDFSIGADDLVTLVPSGGGAAPDVAIGDGEVSLSSAFDLFGLSIPLGVTLVPSASDGSLVLTPTSLTLGEQTFSGEGDDSSFLGQIATALLQPQTLCIAGSVPQALVLADAEIDGDEVVLGFRGDGAALGGPELATPGTCGD